MNKKYWWERLKVVKQGPSKKKIDPELLKQHPKSFFPCREKPKFKVPGYFKTGLGDVAYVYEVKRSPAGWMYTYTELGLNNPNWKTALPEWSIENKKQITKGEAVKILKKRYNADEILK